MKKAILLSGALLALTATVAAAAPGLNLGWNQCGIGGAVNKTFNCNSNSGLFTAVGSYLSGDTEGRSMAGNDIVIDLQSATAPLPAWWAFKNVGTCRQTALTVSADFSSDLGGPNGSGDCQDIWAGQAQGGLAAYNIGYGGPNRARIIVAYGLAASFQTMPAPDTEYGSFRMGINATKTAPISAPGCGGCSDPVCIVLNEVKQTTPGGLFTIRIGAPALRNYVTWQGGQIQPPGCPLATPTRNATWGSVKALYR